MRLALYAHYSTIGGLARYVDFYLRKLRELGFDICFISNSPIPPQREQDIHEMCERVIQRENFGYDFAMWQRAIFDYDLSKYDELLLTNSSIVGPFNKLDQLWQYPAAKESDFWGLTDNDELGSHLQSYFLVFRRPALEHPCFLEFWRSVLPFKDKQIVIQSYEIGLTSWLEQHGLKWKAIFPQEEIQAMLLERRSAARRLVHQIRPRELPKNTSMRLADLLLERGMPFLKTKLLSSESPEKPWRIGPDLAKRLLYASNIPTDIIEELCETVDAGRC
jgi:Lipopolysaccharide biosynthesis protein